MIVANSDTGCFQIPKKRDLVLTRQGPFPADPSRAALPLSLLPREAHPEGSFISSLQGSQASSEVENPELRAPFGAIGSNLTLWPPVPAGTGGLASLEGGGCLLGLLFLRTLRWAGITMEGRSSS